MAVDGLKVELDSELAGRVKVFAAATGANVETVVGEGGCGRLRERLV